MKKRNNVLAIVVTYNRAYFISNTINALLRQTKKCDILVINNGSSDNTSDILNSFSNNQNVIILEFSDNQGMAGGQNHAMKYAVKNEYDYVWVIDDDMIPSGTALENLLFFGEKLDEEWGGLSGGVYWKNGDICEPNRPKTGLFCFVTNEDYKNGPVSVSMVSWGSMFVKTEIIKKVGYPIKEYFIYTDDYEFSSRISNISNLFFIPQSKTYHYIVKNQKVNIANDSASRLNRYYYLFRNDMNFYKRYRIIGLLYVFLKIFVNTLKVILFGNSKLLRIKYIFSGAVDGLSFNPSIDLK